MKWQPFISMVEQGRLLHQVKRRRLEVAQPILSTDQEEQLNQILEEVVFYEEQVTLTIYKSGFFHEVSGIIFYVDPLLGLLKVRNETQETIVYFKNIVKIER